jgi:glycosyltransferase involved in cell wall biosynthesis
MRILIDNAIVGKNRKSGIGSFAYNLALQLNKTNKCDLLVFKVLDYIPRYFKKWSYIGLVNIPYLTKGYNIIHHVSHYSPWIVDCTAHVMTVYDLAELKYPNMISFAWRHYNRYSIRKSIDRVNAIITISNSIKKELLDTFPKLREENIYVCPPGIRSELLDVKPNEKILDDMSIKPYSYFLFVSELTKRKNIKFLLNAFTKAKSKKIIKESTKLILVGKKSIGYKEIAPLIQEELGIREIGFLNDIQLATLYRFSKGFVYPSIYEGFGIPIIEAMNQNTPIIISRIPTSIELHHAHNKQMFHFELGDSDGLISLLSKIDNESSSIREQLNYGDLSKYHYDRIAANHINIYLDILKTI